MEASSKKQNAMIGYLVTRLAIDPETKEELIYNHTAGRTVSIRELSKIEAEKVIKFLTSQGRVTETPASRMRRKIISMAHELGWKVPGGKVNMERLNEWCIKYGYLSKPLNKYRTDELTGLVTQFEKVYLDHLRNI